MRTIQITLGLLIASNIIHAQTLEEGKKQLFHERYESAEHSFHTVIRNQPDQAEAWFGLARSYVMQEQAQKGLDSLKLAPAQVQDEPIYLAGMGSLLLSDNKADAAAPLFARAIDKTKGKNAAILSAVAQAHLDAKNGNMDEVVSLVNRALKRDKNNSALYVQLGDAYLRMNNGSDAYSAYKSALEKNDKDAAAYYRLGKIFHSQKNAEFYLDYFTKAIAADASYAPALYQLYVHYFYTDPAQALAQYQNYMKYADPSLDQEYDLTDLLYLNKQYEQAIAKANGIIKVEGSLTKPRLYKLAGYSHAGMKDTANALQWMKQYFRLEADSNIMAKDYKNMALFLQSLPGQEDSVIVYFEKAAGLEKDPSQQYGYYKSLAELYKGKKDYGQQAAWLGKYYAGNAKATNVDLFNWGLAHFLGEEYKMADSVFGMYVSKYPEQSFGYYWQAKSNAALDSSMKDGLAIAPYQKLISILEKDTANPNYKKWMVEAYAYLAAFEVNNQKDYAEAVDLFEKVLEVDPENESAKKYIGILEKNLTAEGMK
jgi:tetratricopeptide (TPR) repeat protein